MRISDWSSDVCSSDLKAHAESIGGLFVRVNVSDEASVEAGLAAAEAAHGVARILVNCAGLAPAIKTVGRDNTPHPMDVYRKVVEVNLIGTFTMISRFAAKLVAADPIGEERGVRSEEHTSELQSLMRISYAVFCFKKKNINISQARLLKRLIKQHSTKQITKKTMKYYEN